MATSNNDRISSARLLDMLKGLQESRHLGSEPEIETETAEYPAVVSPAAGTYANEADYRSAISIPDENRLPFFVYTQKTYSVPYPITVPDKGGDYAQITKKIDFDGAIAYVEDLFAELASYTGYIIEPTDNGFEAFHYTNGVIDMNDDIVICYVWEMPAKTETITTKTKRTIKQDYVPNADWNVNDPDADGYIQGRTHWVEREESQVPADGVYEYESETELYEIFGITELPTSIEVYFDSPIEIGETSVTVSRNGEATKLILADAFGTRLYVPEEWDGTGMPSAYLIPQPIPNTNKYFIKSNNVYPYDAITETVHKLDSKFIIEPENPINNLDYLKDNEDNFKGKNIGMYKFRNNIDYLAHFNIRKTSNPGNYWLVEANYPEVQTKTMGIGIDYVPSYLFDPKISSAYLILGVIACLPDIELTSLTDAQENSVTLGNKTVDMSNVTFSNDDNSISVSFSRVYIGGQYSNQIGATCVGLASEQYLISCRHKLFLTTPTLYMNGSSSFHKTMENILCWQDNTDTLIIRVEYWLHNQLSREELYLNSYEYEMCDGVLLGKVNIQGLTPVDGVIKKEIDYMNTGNPTMFVRNVVHGAQGGFALVPELNAIVIFKLEPRKMTMYIKAKDFTKLGNEIVFKGEIMPRGFYDVTDEKVQEITNPFN